MLSISSMHFLFLKVRLSPDFQSSVRDASNAILMTGVFACNTAQMHTANTIQINIQNLAVNLGAYLTHAIIVDLQISALEEIERNGAYTLVIHLQVAHSHVANLYGAYTFVINLHHVALGMIDADGAYPLVGNIQLVFIYIYVIMFLHSCEGYGPSWPN